MDAIDLQIVCSPLSVTHGLEGEAVKALRQVYKSTGTSSANTASAKLVDRASEQEVYAQATVMEMKILRELTTTPAAKAGAGVVQEWLGIMSRNKFRIGSMVGDQLIKSAC